MSQVASIGVDLACEAAGLAATGSTLVVLTLSLFKHANFLRCIQRGAVVLLAGAKKEGESWSWSSF